MGDICVFILLEDKSNIHIGRVLQFSFYKESLKKAREYKGKTVNLAASNVADIGILCSWYSKESNSDMKFILNTEKDEVVVHQYQPVSSYLCTLTRDSFETIVCEDEDSSIIKDYESKAIVAKQLTLSKQSLARINILIKERTITSLTKDSQPHNQAGDKSKHSNVWVSFKKLQLNQDDKRILANNQQLNDKHISMAQNLIQNQFPKLKGLMSSLLQLSKPFPNSTDALQVINTGRSHWVLISTVDCLQGDVRLYDPLYSSLSNDTETIVAQLLRTEKSSVSVHIMNVSKQAGSQDCGLFAIAFMTSLAYGNNPIREVYRQDEMRAHLLTCFEKQVMQCFPTLKKRRISNPIVKTTTIAVFCTCRLPYDPDKGEKMVCCDTCDKWYHTHCISEESKQRIQQKNWYCDKCTIQSVKP